MPNIEELLSRRVSDVIVKKNLEKLLLGKKKLKIYLGIDPTGHDLHLGHAVTLLKFREFHQAGHQMILLIGNFTGKIGDPTDKDSMRQPLTDEQIKQNFKTYKKQATKILDFNNKKNPIQYKYNATWLSKLNFTDIIKLASHFTVQQNIERDMFQRRIQSSQPIGLHEFFYPLMQGYDSVAMNVDLEIGGNDQLFNMLVGRTLQRIYHKKDKHVLTTKMLEGTDGRKMSKTYKNTINLFDTPADVFGKTMRIKDDLIEPYFTLATDTKASELSLIHKRLRTENPRDLKLELAHTITTMLHGKKKAQQAQQDFIQVFSKHSLPDNIPKIKLKKGTYVITDLLYQLQLVTTKSDARRMVEQGAVRINQQKWTGTSKDSIDIKPHDIIQVGKRRICKIA